MKPSLDPIFRSTTPIKYAGLSGHATGFFYRTSQNTYLVTCRHAIYSPSKSEIPFLSRASDQAFHPDEIHIRIRDQQNPTSTTSKTMELYNADGSPKWIEPDYYSADIVAIPLDFSLSETGNVPFGTANLSVERRSRSGFGENTNPGDSAVVAGYPILNSSNHTPILRSALISSPLGLDLVDQPYFLIDAKLHDGTSGSPVLIRTENYAGQSILSLIGVHAGRYNIIERGSENLNRVWFMEHLQKKLREREPDLLDLW